MIADAALTAFLGFGAAAFCFSAGLVIGCTRKGGAATFPATHVSFEFDLSTEDRLMFLDSARMAVLEGRLCNPQQLGDEAARDER